MVVTTDSVVARELKSLQDEVAPPGPDSPALSDQASANAGTAADAAPPEAPAQENEDRGALADLTTAIREFVDAAESNAAAHPTANLIGALVVGILIGRLLGRR